MLIFLFLLRLHRPQHLHNNELGGGGGGAGCIRELTLKANEGEKRGYIWKSHSLRVSQLRFSAVEGKTGNFVQVRTF